MVDAGWSGVVVRCGCHQYDFQRTKYVWGRADLRGKISGSKRYDFKQPTNKPDIDSDFFSTAVQRSNNGW